MTGLTAEEEDVAPDAGAVSLGTSPNPPGAGDMDRSDQRVHDRRDPISTPGLRQYPEYRGDRLCDHCESETPLQAGEDFGMCSRCWPLIRAEVYEDKKAA
jgi:hypothetical protein